jgi:hypothetical protein
MAREGGIPVDAAQWATESVVKYTTAQPNPHWHVPLYTCYIVDVSGLRFNVPLAIADPWHDRSCDRIFPEGNPQLLNTFYSACYGQRFIVCSAIFKSAPPGTFMVGFSIAVSVVCLRPIFVLPRPVGTLQKGEILFYF